MPMLDCTTLVIEHAGGVLPLNVAQDLEEVAMRLTRLRAQQPELLVFSSPSGERVYLPRNTIDRIVVMYDNKIEVRDPRIAVPPPRVV